MSEEPIHLAKSFCHDEDSMWCTEMPVGLQTRDVREATCSTCLQTAATYGAACLARAVALHPVESVNTALKLVADILGKLPFGMGTPGCTNVGEDEDKSFMMLAGADLAKEFVSLKIMGDNLRTYPPDAIAFARQLVVAALEVETPP